MRKGILPIVFALVRRRMIEDSDLYFILLYRACDESILVKTHTKMLPTITYDESLGKDIDKLCFTVQRELGTPFAVRFLREECEEQIPRMGGHSGFCYSPVLLVFVATDEDKKACAPQGFQWIPKEEANTVVLDPPAPSVTYFMRSYAIDGLEIHTERLKPHSRLGFFEEARSWIEFQLQHVLSETVDSVTQIASNPSFVARVSTDNGLTYYMKGVKPEKENREIQTTVAVGKNLPKYFEKHLAVDAERHWLLMRDQGTTMAWGSISAKDKPDEVSKVLTDWATIQRQSIRRKPALLRDGVPLRDGQEIIREAKKMTEDPLWFQAQKLALKRNEGKIPEETQYKRQLLQHLAIVLQKVAKYHVPLTLVHGDLNPVNIVWKKGSPCKFLDFEATCISFPFLDVCSFANACGATDDSIEAYLECWLEYESMDRLRHLLDVTKELDDIISILYFYKQYQDIEECHRFSAYHEIASFAAIE